MSTNDTEQSAEGSGDVHNFESNVYDDTFIGQLESSFRNSISIPSKADKYEKDNAAAKVNWISWMVSNADIDRTQAMEYAEVFLIHGVTDEKKLAKRLKRNDQALELLGIPKLDSMSITAALRRDKLIEARVVSLRNTPAVSISTADTAVPPIPTVDNCSASCTPSLDTAKVVAARISVTMQRVIEANDSSAAEAQAKDVCRNIIEVAGESAEIQEALGLQGICEDLVTILTIYTSESSRVVQTALCAVSVLCRRKVDDKGTQCISNIKRLGEVRACQCAVAALRKYDDSLLVIKWATSCIRNLCCLDANLVFFLHSGACVALMHLAHKYKTNEDVIRWVFRAMGKLSGNNENRLSLVHHGFCEFVLEIMCLHYTSALVMADSCWTLRKIASGDQSCRSKLVQLRACECVSRAVLDHYQVDIVILEAIRALLALTKDSEDTVHRLIAAGSLNVFVLPLLGTKDTTQYSSSIQTSCCGESSAVVCLTALYTISASERVRTALLDCGAIEAIVSAMNHHPQAGLVAVWCCKCIHRLSSSPVAQKKTRKSSICESLAQLLRRDLARNDPLTAEWAGLAISIVAVDKFNRSNLDEFGVCEALTSVLRHHERNPDVAYRMCGAVHFMSLDDGCRSKLGSLGAGDVVTEVLRYHTDCAANLSTLDQFHEGAVQASARAIGSLAFEHQLNCSRLDACGACDVVLSSAKVFQGSIAMTEFCCRAVARLCAVEEISTHMGENGVISCVLDALRLYPQSEAVVKHGFFALNTLTNTDLCPTAAAENVKRILSEPESLIVVLGVLEKHGASIIETAQIGCVLVSRLVVVDGMSDDVTGQLRTFESGIVQYACRVLLSCLKTFPVDESIHYNGLSCIACFIKHSGAVSAFLFEAGFPDVLLSSLRQFASHHVIGHVCLVAAMDLVTMDGNRNMFGTMAACEAIIGSMKCLRSDREVARTACNLIIIISENESARGMLGSFQVTDVLVDILRTFAASDTPDVVGSAVLALMSLCASDEITHSLSQSNHVFDILCGLLAESIDNLAICEWICRLVILLLGYSPSSAVVDDSPTSDAHAVYVDEPVVSPQLMLPSIIDEPRVGSDSSSPKFLYRTESLLGVCPAQSSNSSNIVSGGADPAIFLSKKTFPNVSSFVDSSLHAVLSRILSLHGANKLLVWLACEGLALICMEDFGAGAMVSDPQCNSCDLICSLLQQYLHSDFNIEIAAVKVIANIARHRDFAAVLGTSGACGLVVPFLRVHFAESLDSVIVGCSAVAYLCKRNPNNKISLAAAGACEVCSDCLHKFIFDPRVIPHVLHAIKCLCSQNKFNTSQFSARGILDFIVDNLLNTEIMDADISLVGSTLWCVAHLPPSSMKTLSSPAVMDFILLHLRKNVTSLQSSGQTNAYVAMAACDAVYSMCANLSSTRVTFAAQDTCETILMLIRNYEHDENVLHSGLMAIANLVDCSPENRAHVKVVIILKTLQVRCDSVVVVRAAFAALLGMIHDNPAYPVDLSSVNAIKIILKATFLHMYCEVVSKRACILQALLASHDKVYQKILGAEGACNIALDIISAHGDNGVVMREACWALCSLSHKHDTNRGKIIRIGGIEILTGLLRKYSGNEPVVLWCCGTLANIAASKTATNCSKFIEVDTCTVAVEILHLYMDGSETVLRYVCWVIGNLASVASLASYLGDIGACEGIVLALMKQVASAAVAQLACTAIWHLAKVPENRKKLEDAGALTAIDNALKSHDRDAGVTKWITKAKSSFAGISLFRSLSMKNDGSKDTTDSTVHSRGSSSGSVEFR